MKTVLDYRDIDIQRITRLEFALTGNAMADDVIDGCTD